MIDETKHIPESEAWGKLLSLSYTHGKMYLTENRYIIGRNAESDIKINDKRVSKTHCSIEKKGNKVYIVDSSTNGTYINKNKIFSGQTILFSNPKDLDPQSINDICSALITVYYPAMIGFQIHFLFEISDSTSGLSDRIQQKSPTTDSLKRPQPEPLDNSNHTLKMTKDKDNYEDYICPYCKRLIWDCVTLEPCGHSYCAGCMSQWMEIDATKDNEDLECFECELSVEKIVLDRKKAAEIEEYLKKFPERSPTTAEKVLKKEKNVIFETINFNTKNRYKDKEELEEMNRKKQEKVKQDDLMQFFDDDNSNDFEIAKALKNAGNCSPPRTRRFTRERDKTLAKTSSLFKGIDNIINTCYISSVVQMLYFCKEFRQQLLSLDIQEKNGKNLIFRTQKIFALLSKGESPSVKPYFFKIALPKDFANSKEQHDASEFAKSYLDELEKLLKNTKGKTLVKDLLTGELITQTQCTDCNEIFKRKEDFLDIGLSFDINKPDLKYSLTEMLKKTRAEDYLLEDNRYHCDKCNKLSQLAVKKTYYTKFPPFLMMTLHRFYFDPKTFRRKKLLNEVTIPDLVDLELEEENKPAKKIKYELKSVLVHRGRNLDVGHYYTFVKPIDNAADWCLFDDHKVIELPAMMRFDEYDKDDIATPYILLYKRENFKGEMDDKEPLLSRTLESEIREENKGYDFKEDGKEYSFPLTSAQPAV